MTRIFTKWFFRLSTHNQAAVVQSALADIEKNYGRYITSDDEKQCSNKRPASERRQSSTGY